jgi:Fic family protein
VSRSGRFVKQREGYEAFEPAPLPPTPPLILDLDLVRLLSEADQKLARLDGVTSTLPNPDLFVAMYVRQEATDKARRILALREQHRQMILGQRAINSANALRLLDRLYEQPLVNVRLVEQWLGCVYATANKLLGQLLALGLLVEVTGHERNRRFSYEPYLQLFSRTKDDPSGDDTTPQPR